MIILALIIIYILWNNYTIAKEYGIDSKEYREWIDFRFTVLALIYFIALFFILEGSYYAIALGTGIILAGMGAITFKKRYWGFLFYMGPLWYYLIMTDHGSLIHSCTMHGGKVYGTIGKSNTLWNCFNFFVF